MRLHTLRARATVALLAIAVLSLRQDARAHGHFAVGFGFHAPYGFPYPGPYPYYSGNPPRWLESARARGMGALELHAKPGKAEVYVDEKLAGRAGDFDGSPRLLWLKKGTHRIRVALQGHETFTEDYSLAPGEVFEVHVKLKK